MNNLLKLSLIVSICLASVNSFAAITDTTKTAASPQQKYTEGSNAHKLSSYGSVFIKSTRIMGKYNPQVGGMGAIVFNNKIAAGAFGNGLMQSVDFLGSNLNDNQTDKLYLKYGYGGLFVEYFLIRNSRFQLSMPLKLGYGLAGVYSETTDDRIEKSRLIVLEPELHFDIKTGKHLALSAQFGYRFADVDGLHNITDNHLSGFSVGLGLKFISR
ncbi:MAG: hypothetical protein PHX54_02075 [Lentimicrobiaceae bacterium]|nr:hypothetical protein [Lentimicrobiaceae bacterium]